MRLCLLIVVCVQIFGAHSLIVPDEVPTILSVIYSNIPVIKKGTDSRIGWGFRLGDRADFQVLVELGPQMYTQPLANQEDKNGNSKRNTLDTLANTLYAQRQKDKQKKKQKEVVDTEGGKWLESWRKGVQQEEASGLRLPPGAKPGIAIGEIDAKSVIPDDVPAKEVKTESVQGDVENVNDATARLAELYKAGESQSATAET